jgi:acyl-CoA synthetase
MIEQNATSEARKSLYYRKGWWGTDTIADVWNARVAATPDRTFVKDERSGQTFRDIDRDAARLAGWLSAQGVGNGDVVTFQMPKWTECAVCVIACMKAGAVMHPLDVHVQGPRLAEALRASDSAAYLAPTCYHGRDYEAEAAALHDVPGLRARLFVDRESAAHDVARALSTVLASAEPLAAPAPSHADDIACILSTSGSTGTPKQALFTHNNILFSERSYLSVLDLSPDDVMWMPSPLHHATGLFHGLIAAALLGGTTVLQERYSPAAAVELINREGCTWSHGATPFIFDLLRTLDESKGTLPSLRFYICGGAPVPPSLIAHAWRYKILLSESYGSTESCPHAYVPLDEVLEWNGRFSGIPYEGIEVRVVDADHNPMPAGVQGEEASRGPNVFVGYLNEPERTARALDEDGWFYSGDLCTMDAKGRIRINGRMKEIIIRGGENISAREVDEAVTGAPGVGDHATVGVPDERLGERICLFTTVPAGETAPTVASVTAWLAGRGVPKRIWPERIETIDAIPHTATGKVQRFKLTAELERRMAAAAPASE